MELSREERIKQMVEEAGLRPARVKQLLERARQAWRDRRGDEESFHEDCYRMAESIPDDQIQATLLGIIEFDQPGFLEILKSHLEDLSFTPDDFIKFAQAIISSWMAEAIWAEDPEPA